MDKAPNNYMNIDNQNLYSSTISWVYEFDLAEEVNLSKIFDFPQEQPVNTNIISRASLEYSSPNYHQNSGNVSKLPNVIPKEKQPMTATNIPSYSSKNKNFSRKTHITLDEDDDYSLSYIYSMGLNNVSKMQEKGGTSKNSNNDGINQENPKIFNPMPSDMEKQGDTISRRRDQENPKINDMILQQSLSKIRVSSLKSKFTLDQPLRISTDSWKEQKKPKDPYMSKIFDFPQEKPVNTNIISSASLEYSSQNHHQNSENVSELPNVIPKEKQPMTATNIPSYSSTNENFLRKTQITLDENDDYSLSYIYSMGLNNVSKMQEEGGTRKNSNNDGINQENPKTFIPIPIVMEKQGDTINISRRRNQENHKTNEMILQQPLSKIPILEKLEREPSLKSKFTINQPLKISTDFWKEQKNPKTKDPYMSKIPCLKRDFMKPTYHSSFGILEQQKLMIHNKESDFLKPKFFVNHPYGITTRTRTEEQENPKSNGMIHQRPMQHILTLEKLESHFMKSKLMAGQENGTFKQRIGSDGYGIFSSLDNEFPQKKSTSGGPTRRSPDRTSSRYQPFGREIDPNNQGSDRVHQSSSKSIFNRSQISKEGIVSNIGKPWKNQLNEIKSKIGIASDYARSSNHKYKMLNNIQGKSDSSQVAEIEKQNGNNEEAFAGRSSNLVNHSNHNFLRSPAYTHEITNKFKGVASGQNFNQYTQGNVYSNQAITLRSLNSRKENEDGAPDQLQSSWTQSWNAQDRPFNTTTNWPWGPFR